MLHGENERVTESCRAGGASADIAVLCTLSAGSGYLGPNLLSQGPITNNKEGAFPVTSATQGSTGLAERYAGALFDLAEADGALDQVNGELQALGGLIRDSKDLERVIRSPVISRGDQRNAIDAILEKQGASPLTRRFVGLVAHNRRLFALLDIIAAYKLRLERSRGETSAEVISAQPLTQDQVAAVGAALKKVVGSQVVLSTRTDPSLLGGLVVKLGSRMVDSSLKTKLLRLSFAIKGIG